MVNQKRKVSQRDFLDCYSYFQRAIQSDRFMKDSINDEIDGMRENAISAFSDISLKEEGAIGALQRWIEAFVDSASWGRCYRALNQKKYLAKDSHQTVNLTKEAYRLLKAFATSKGLNFSEAIVSLLTSNDKSSNEVTQLTQKTVKPASLDDPVSRRAASSNVIALFKADLPVSQHPEVLLSESEPDGFYFDEEIHWPRKPENYDFRQNESYKKYKQRIKTLTIKKLDEDLLAYFNNTINYYLKEDNCQAVGEHLLLIRQQLLDQHYFKTEFDPSLFAISKGITQPNYQWEGYGDELLYYLGQIFGCDSASISAGKKELYVFAGHKNQVQIAYKAFNYLNAFLSDEVENHLANCHKNTKRKNGFRNAAYHGSHLVSLMLNSILEEEEHKLLSSEEEDKLSQYTDNRVGVYFDENEPLGGWYNEKNDLCRW